MVINWERGHIWHDDCPENKWHSGIIRVVRDDAENRRSLMQCLHCGQQGWLPYGSVGCVTVETVTQ